MKVAKICDFGFAHRLDDSTRTTQTGTIEWMAPEVIEGKEYSKECDVFSYGTVLWELVTHEVPFEGRQHLDIQKSIVEGKMLAIPVSVEGYLCDVIHSCWSVDPTTRLPLWEILDQLKSEGGIAYCMQGVSEMCYLRLLGIDITQLVFKGNIGRGTTGSVCKGHLAWKDCKDVAIKQVLLLEEIMGEVSILSGLKHPNIITFYGTASTDHHFYIVMELAMGSLYGYIEQHRSKPDMELNLRWAAEVAKGMKYLHGKDIVHRDLKSPNVLLTSAVQVAKICDFGTARELDHTTEAGVIGTYAWMAPEVINGEAYSKTCDLFSYGTVLWEMVTHEVPFESLGDFRIMVDITSGKMPAIPADVEGYLSDMIQQCWNMDPEMRLSFINILSVLRNDQHTELEATAAVAIDKEDIKIDGKPLLQHLQLLPSAKGPIKVAAEINDNWEKVAEQLKLPEYHRGQIAKQIALESCAPEQQAVVMLEKWLEEGYYHELPPTWETLIAALIITGYEGLARKIWKRTVE